MKAKFNVGDNVYDATGRESVVSGINIQYTLNDGSVWSEESLTPIPKSNPDDILVSDMCHKLDVSLMALRSADRHRYIVSRRQVIYYVLHKKYRWRYSRICAVSNRTHASIIFGVRQCEDFLSIKDREYTELYNKIK